MPHRLAVGAALAAGALIAVQSKVNGELTDILGYGIVAALVSFTCGTTVWLLGLAVTGRWRNARRLASGTRWWWWLGGLGGAFLVASLAVAVPETGVALAAVAFVAGATTGGLLVDRAGIGPGGAHPVNLQRTAGSLLALLGLTLAAAGATGRSRPALLAAVAVAGAFASVQQAANGHLRQRSGDPFVAASVNFVVGALALGALTGLLAAAGAVPDLDWPTNPVLYLGGLGGAAYITLSAATVAQLGVLRVTLATMAGQVLGALALDTALPTAGRPGLATVVAAALTLVAVVVAGRGEV